MRPDTNFTTSCERYPTLRHPHTDMKAKFKALKRRTVQKVMGGTKGKDGESAVATDPEFDGLVRTINWWIAMAGVSGCIIVAAAG